MIQRLHGRGTVLKRGGEADAALLPLVGPEPPCAPEGSPRELVQTSCGCGVPLFDYRNERDTPSEQAGRKGPDGIAACWEDKDIRAIEGLTTGLLD